MSAAPDDLPFNKPRVLSVEEPSTGHYVVGILVDSSRANRKITPNWGSTLSSAGMLTIQDMLITPAQGGVEVDISDYKLTDVKPDNTGKNQIWLYQKLPGKVRRKKTKGAPDIIPDSFKSLVTTTTTQQPVELGTEPDAPSGSLVESSVDEGDAGSAVLSNTTREIDAYTELVGKKQDTWGINTRTRKLSLSNTITPAFKVKDVETTPLSPGMFAYEKEEYPDSPTTLVEYRTDEDLGVLIKIEKSLVDTASAPPAYSATSVFERQSIDKWNSIQLISTRVGNTLPASETFSTIVSISMPDFLHSVGVIWLPDSDISSSSSGVIGAAHYPDISWSLSATAHAKASIVGNGWVRIINGYSGPANASVTRSFSIGPPTGTLSIHKFQTVAGQLIINNMSYNRDNGKGKGGYGDFPQTTSGTFAASFNRAIHYTNFAGVEHDSPNIIHTGTATVTASSSASAGSIPGGGTYPSGSADAVATGTAELILPTSSTPLSSGATFVMDINVEKRRFGIWMKEVITAIVP